MLTEFLSELFSKFKRAHEKPKVVTNPVDEYQKVQVRARLRALEAEYGIPPREGRKR